MGTQSARVLDHTAPEQPFPYTAVVEYLIGWGRPKHVICAGSSEGLRSAFEGVNAKVEGEDGYKENGGFIDRVVISGPFKKRWEMESFLGSDGVSFYDVGVAAKNVSDAIRSLEMH